MSNYLHNAIFVHTKDEAPQVEHYAIFKFSSIHVPGDERSRTNPGHGYPAHSEPVVEYRAYLKKEDWMAAVEDLAGRVYETGWVAAKVTPATISTKIKIEVREGGLDRIA